MFCVVWDYSNSELKDKQYKKKPSLKSNKTVEIKILVNPWLTQLGFEQLHPGWRGHPGRQVFCPSYSNCK